ncbi:hypothetical protein [Spirilliplanes yamanashiensis]|uniref:Uncharacterized protein n=1 Tax=Spirilliplanes yamanashiensis TaxID=42233 RepID=A0A8J3Y7Z0_9ACTN|nr:hypothetical protein [Spirilliplanes yamanashiensis]MDP9817377.1 hypothetical protein [Spirilliplanes yamanashiensis]GIJ02972.1 hypothetical protein Sya03_23240 [Spirilliplanes yamanashiensis]
MRRALIVAGVLVTGYAIAGAAGDPDLSPGGVLVFLVAVLVAHDAAVMPAAIGAGALITRWVPPDHRTPVRVAALCSAVVTVVAVPLRLGAGGLPLTRLLVVLAVVWAAAAAAIAVRAIRKHLERRAAAAGG